MDYNPITAFRTADIGAGNGGNTVEGNTATYDSSGSRPRHFQHSR